jgi:hypothetical protein
MEKGHSRGRLRGEDVQEDMTFKRSGRSVQEERTLKRSGRSVQEKRTFKRTQEVP